MRGFGRMRRWRIASVVLVVALTAACTGPFGRHFPSTDVCSGFQRLTACGEVSFTWMAGYDDPATPNSLDRVGVLKVGSPWARNVLVLNPGTSAGSAYFLPLAQDIVRETRGAWQVWSVERRENQLEDQSVLNLYKQHKVGDQTLFDYYLGWLANPAVTDHFQLIPDSDVAYRARLGSQRRDGGSAPRRRGGARPRPARRARRPLARRVDDDRVRDLGLQRHPRSA